MWAILAAGAALVGGIISAAATSQQSKAEEEMALANQTQAEKEAGQIREAYGLQLSDLKTQQARFMGQQKAMIGKSGVKLTTGSPLELLAETSRVHAEDVRRLKLAGEIEAGGRAFEASQYGKQAEAYRKTRPWQVAGSLFGSIGQASSYFI